MGQDKIPKIIVDIDCQCMNVNRYGINPGKTRFNN